MSVHGLSSTFYCLTLDLPLPCHRLSLSVRCLSVNLHCISTAFPRPSTGFLTCLFTALSSTFFVYSLLDPRPSTTSSPPFPCLFAAFPCTSAVFLLHFLGLIIALFPTFHCSFSPPLLVRPPPFRKPQAHVVMASGWRTVHTIPAVLMLAAAAGIFFLTEVQEAHRPFSAVLPLLGRKGAAFLRCASTAFQLHDRVVTVRSSSTGHRLSLLFFQGSAATLRPSTRHCPFPLCFHCPSSTKVVALLSVCLPWHCLSFVIPLTSFSKAVPLPCGPPPEDTASAVVLLPLCLLQGSALLCGPPQMGTAFR